MKNCISVRKVQCVVKIDSQGFICVTELRPVVPSLVSNHFLCPVYSQHKLKLMAMLFSLWTPADFPLRKMKILFSQICLWWDSNHLPLKKKPFWWSRMVCAPRTEWLISYLQYLLFHITMKQIMYCREISLIQLWLMKPHLSLNKCRKLLERCESAQQWNKVQTNTLSQGTGEGRLTYPL